MQETRAVSYTHLAVYKRQPKFHNHSYGFRANRSAPHALGRVTSLINISKYHYCVDVDIKGFFDNVNHGKLLKQIWTPVSYTHLVQEPLSKKIRAAMNVAVISTLARGRNWGNSGRN